MKPVKYNIDKDILRDKYTKEFKTVLPKMEDRWKALKKSYLFLASFQMSVFDLMISDFAYLIDVYLKYTNIFSAWKKSQTEVALEQYKQDIYKLFDYGKYRDKIAEFFINEGNKFDINVCHYCETVYVNSYSAGGKKKRHFDLDHVLDKGNCPLVGLSLFNFVPSCQCCNERIKRQQIFGDSVPRKMFKLSPTTDAFNFDDFVEIKVYLKKMPFSKGYVVNKDSYGLKFVTTDNDYDDFIKKLQLEERYDYHKIVALRLLDLADTYTDSTILQLAELLRTTPVQVKEDIFGESFVSDNNRCFDKLIKDTLKYV